jgi:hypothetical protein
MSAIANSGTSRKARFRFTSITRIACTSMDCENLDTEPLGYPFGGLRLGRLRSTGEGKDYCCTVATTLPVRSHCLIASVVPFSRPR